MTNFKQYQLGEQESEQVQAPIGSPESGLINVGGKTVLRHGSIESLNYRSGQLGWSFNSEGDVEIRGLTHGITIYKSGVATRDMTAASGAQDIAHNLGKAPDYVRITAKWVIATNASTEVNSVGTYDGTNTGLIYMGGSVAGSDIEVGNSTTNIVFILEATSGPVRQVASITTNVTNIRLSWTKSGTTSGGNIQLLWEAWARI